MRSCSLSLFGVFYFCISGAIAVPGPEIDKQLQFNGATRPLSAMGLVSECRDAQQLPANSDRRRECERLDQHIHWLENRLNSLCKEAGERIVQTVPDVDAIYVKPPSRNPNVSFVFFHEEDRLAGNYMAPTLGRHYSQWEMNSFGNHTKFDRRQNNISFLGPRRAKIDQTHQQVENVSAKYGITWRSIGREEDRKHGLYGDETTVFKVDDGTILGSRKFYYYVLQPDIVDENGLPIFSQRWDRRSFPEVVQTCRNFRISEDYRYIDRRPRDSYDFAARVLKPRVMPDELAAGIFELARGSGTRSSNCYSITFGPRISQGDLAVWRISERGIKISLRGGSDALICSDYFNPATRDLTMHARHRFYDGRQMTGKDLEKLISPKEKGTANLTPSSDALTSGSATPALTPAPAPAAPAAPAAVYGHPAKRSDRAPEATKPASGSIARKVIKCIDAEGNVSYSDTPCNVRTRP